jgi:hypothetical protein
MTGTEKFWPPYSRKRLIMQRWRGWVFFWFRALGTGAGDREAAGDERNRFKEDAGSGGGRESSSQQRRLDF